MDTQVIARQDEDEVEIDLLGFLQVLKKNLVAIIMAGIAGGLLAGILTYAMIEPTYTSSAMIYMRGAGNTVSSLADLQIGAELTNDYSIIFTSRTVLEEVVEDLDLDMSWSALRPFITITNPEDSRILQVTVVREDPQEAADIANSLIAAGIERVKEIDAKEPYIVESAIATAAPTGPNVKRNAAIGVAAGMVLLAGIFFIHFVTHDSIQTSEDVERHLQVPVLCEIPEEETEGHKKGRRRAKKRSA